MSYPAVVHVGLTVLVNWKSWFVESIAISLVSVWFASFAQTLVSTPVATHVAGVVTVHSPKL